MPPFSLSVLRLVTPPILWCRCCGFGFTCLMSAVGAPLLLTGPLPLSAQRLLRRLSPSLSQPIASVCAGANVVEELVAVVTARTCRCSPLLDGGRVCCCTGWFAFIGIACIAAVTSVVAIVVVDAAPALPLHVAKESIVARTSVVNADCKFITVAIATMILLPFLYARPLHPSRRWLQMPPPLSYISPHASSLPLASPTVVAAIVPHGVVRNDVVFGWC